MSVGATIAARFADARRSPTGPALDIAPYAEALQRHFTDALRELETTAAEATADDPAAMEPLKVAIAHLDWLQWALWDLPVFAAALDVEPEAFGRRAAAAALVYLSGRLLDDLVDRHFFYRRRRHTVLATLAARTREGYRAERAALLLATLVLDEGCIRLLELGAGPAPARAFRAAILGALLELDGEGWTAERYERLARLKNVAYAKVLLWAVDPPGDAPLSAFLERYYLLAQRVNDLEDGPGDAARGQPNLGGILGWDESALVESVATDVGALLACADTLPARQRVAALGKLQETLDGLASLGSIPRTASVSRDGCPICGADAAGTCAVCGHRWSRGEARRASELWRVAWEAAVVALVGELGAGPIAVAGPDADSLVAALREVDRDAVRLGEGDGAAEPDPAGLPGLAPLRHPLIVLDRALECAESPLAVLTAASRAVSPGGALLLLTCDPSSLPELSRIPRPGAGDLAGIRHRFSTTSLARACEHAGLFVVHDHSGRLAWRLPAPRWVTLFAAHGPNPFGMLATLLVPS